MLLQILTIARNTFVESIRQPIFFVLVMACGILQFFNTWTAAYSMAYDSSAEVSGDNKVLLDIGLGTVFLCGMLLAAFVATAVVSKEIEKKTVLTVVSKPVSRPTVILGKYAGVAGAILVAVVIMLVFLLMGIRHGVMTTAADTIDQPVVVFSLGAVAIALAVAVWANFFYGWYFSQTSMLLLLPLIVLGYVLVLLVGKKWEWQAIGTDFKPQVTIACLSLGLAVLVLTSIATAVSTRLGQVMTIVVCAGVFMLGLLSNYLVGRYAFDNAPVAQIREAIYPRGQDEGFRTPGDTCEIVLSDPPRVALPPGTSFHYGPNPNGFDMAVPPFPRFEGDPSKEGALLLSDTPGAVIVTKSQGLNLTIRNIGAGVRAERGPLPDDWVFTRPTRVHPVALVVWSVIPNMQHYWLVDAVSQNRRVPAAHLARIGLYALLQITTALALGVILFQKRDVG